MSNQWICRKAPMCVLLSVCECKEQKKQADKANENTLIAYEFQEKEVKKLLFFLHFAR